MHRCMHYVLLLQQQQRQSQPLAFLLFDFDASTIFATLLEPNTPLLQPPTP